MTENLLEDKIRTLIFHAWDEEVRWPHIQAWMANFTGKISSPEEEKKHSLFALSRFMYFSRRMVREMLKSLYRDHFKSALIQRIRRNYNDSKDVELLKRLYEQELKSTRFLGVGNPSESGAHLLYFFRQVNYLPKDLFIDIADAFHTQATRTKNGAALEYQPKLDSINRLVFFDDLVGSGNQSSSYLGKHLKRLKSIKPELDLRFMSLFATTHGLAKLNASHLFDGKASCLFELDESFKAFDPDGRHFSNPPSWFDEGLMKNIAQTYGNWIRPGFGLGYEDSQLLLGFSHNTPDNTLSIFWDEGKSQPWTPVFVRYHKVYQ
jgi:hypothetical protein